MNRSVSPINRSRVPLNDRINPDYEGQLNANYAFSPSRMNNEPVSNMGRRFGSPPPEDNDYSSVGSNYDPRENFNTGANGQLMQSQPM